MNQPVRLYPGGMIDVMKYQLPFVMTATASMPVCAFPMVAQEIEIKQCLGCGARKEQIVSENHVWRKVCAYCKGPK